MPSFSRDVARLAGALLLDLRAGFGSIEGKDEANDLRKQADRASHELIMAESTAARPGDAILSEEGKDDDRRLSADRVWIVDPLDGTWEYGQGRNDFAVHIALWEPASATLSATVVDLPGQGLSRTALDTASVPGPLPQDRPLRIVASRSRPPATRAAPSHCWRNDLPMPASPIVASKSSTWDPWAPRSTNSSRDGPRRTFTTLGSMSGTSRRHTGWQGTTGSCRLMSTAAR